MSKTFYDKHLSLDVLERGVKKMTKDHGEMVELWGLIDELIHHRVLGCVLTNLDHKHHKEFVVKLYHEPHKDGIIEFLKRKIQKDVEAFIKAEIESVSAEIVEDIYDTKKKL